MGKFCMKISYIWTSFKTFCEMITKKWVKRTNIIMAQQTYVLMTSSRDLQKGKREHTKSQIKEIKAYG